MNYGAFFCPASPATGYFLFLSFILLISFLLGFKRMVSRDLNITASPVFGFRTARGACGNKNILPKP